MLLLVNLLAPRWPHSGQNNHLPPARAEPPPAAGRQNFFQFPGAASVAFTQLAGQMLALRRAAPLLRRAPPPPRRLRPAALAPALGTDRQRWGLGAALAKRG